MTKTAAQPDKRTDNSCPAPPLRPSPATFDALVAEQAPRITRLCYRLLGWRTDVADVVQDVFLAAFRALPTFRGASDVSTWLTRIAVNVCRTHGRRRQLHLRLLSIWRSRSDRTVAPPADAAALGNERAARVRAALQRLPAQAREVLVLRYLEDLSADQIGAILGLSRNAVDVRLNRARQRMKDSLAEFPKAWCDEK